MKAAGTLIEEVNDTDVKTFAEIPVKLGPKNSANAVICADFGGCN